MNDHDVDHIYLAKEIGLDRKTVKDYVDSKHCPTNYMVVVAICIVLQLEFTESLDLLMRARMPLKYDRMDVTMQVHYSALTETSSRNLKGWNEEFVRMGVGKLDVHATLKTP